MTENEAKKLFDEMSAKKLDFLDQEFNKKMPGIETDHRVICEECRTETRVAMETSDFLFREPPRRTQSS